jgi:hypothetical protein
MKLNQNFGRKNLKKFKRILDKKLGILRKFVENWKNLKMDQKFLNIDLKYS